MKTLVYLCLLLLVTPFLQKPAEAQQIFAITNYGNLYLIDPASCNCQHVMSLTGVTSLDDIALSGSKIYGILQAGATNGKLYVLDTNAASTTLITSTTYTGNALTSDKSGNLYLVYNNSTGDLYRYHIGSGQHTLLGSIGKTQGDLAFMDDTLYAVCDLNKLKRIVLNPFSVTLVGTITLPFYTPYLFGLATFDDGQGLCISALGMGMAGPQLYRLNKNDATTLPLCTTLTPMTYDEMINGLAYEPTYNGPATGIRFPSATDVVSVMPNPARDRLVINFGNAPAESGTITVTNLQGTELKEIVTDMTGALNIDISDLPDGFYLLSVVSQNGLMNRKFIKKN
ncbi:MAG TPA: T9SS type A sorting domain-containing protein [Bacteroidales bacterium]|nr:T9SS type A sorting domain-containing protein [Bacteroidales bacterium]